MNFVWLLLGQNPMCLERGEGGDADFAGESDQRSAKEYLCKDGAAACKTLCLLCRGTR